MYVSLIRCCIILKCSITKYDVLYPLFSVVNADTVNLKLRPIYNVAHMVNGNSQLNEDWVDDANAIEADLEFNADGSPKRFYHGSPCDCRRSCSHENDPITHFATLRRKAQDEIQKFALFWIDLKLSYSKITDFYSSGQKLAKLMTRSDSLFPPGEDVPIDVLVGAEALNQKNFHRGFKEYISQSRPELLPKFGYDFSGSNDIDDILDTFEEIGITENIWMGDGITNCLFKPRTRLKEILAKRDSYTGSGLAPFKVYAWTVDSESTMREYLMLGVDAIIVNYPDRMKSLVTDEFTDSLFLATRATDPWKRIKKSEAVPPLAQGCKRGECWKYTNPSDWCSTSSTCSRDTDCSGSISCV